METKTPDVPWYRSKLLLLVTIAGFLVVATIDTLTLTFNNRDRTIRKIDVFESGISKVNLENFSLTVKHLANTTIPKKNEPSCEAIRKNDRFECLASSKEECLERGCCYNFTANEKEAMGPPSCFYPPDYSGYKVVNSRRTQTGILAKLQRNKPSGFPKDIQEVKVEISFMDESMLNIKISDPNNVRYEVPFPKLNKVHRGKGSSRDAKYVANFSQDGELTISRTGTGVKVFDANLARMIFADQLLQLNIKSPSDIGYYGIGESKAPLLLGTDWKRYLLFNRDNYPTRGLNMYGTHPFYLQMEKDGNAHGVFLFNSNSMEVITQPTPGITFRTIGGVFDFYVFMGTSPSQVIQQYTKLIGHTFMPPYWSLGFHLCRYGYGSVTATRAAWKRTMDAQIPFDVQWNDIDYMDNYNDFTVDPKNFSGLGEFVDEIHEKNMHYVMITDVGIGGPDMAGKYQPYDDGVKMDCLVKNVSGDVLVGKVWNTGATTYPDFTHPKADEYLTRQYQLLYKTVKYDGSWIDMNEPANFVNGSVDGCPVDSSLENPPYIPGNLEPLHTRTLCMTAQHHASTHYNVHSIHSLTQAIATNAALRNVLPNRRPFIISRSSYAGLGHFAGHWNGDISSTWDDYQWSIPSILTFGMFGVSMMGADICGFKWNTTVELCARWQTVGAFYPFSRNHNDFDTFDQDPVMMGPIVEKATREALLIRYRLLPFLYTLFHKSHVDGETVARPLFFEFPGDTKTYSIDSIFLWGPALLIIPVMEEGSRKVSAYIPKDVWYDYNNGSQVQSSGQIIEFDAPLTKINLLVRGGHILPGQVPGVNTVESRQNKFTLLVALKNDSAVGELYWDQGDTSDAYEKKEYHLVKFTVKNKMLSSTIVNHGYIGQPMTLGEIKFLGASDWKKVTVNGKLVTPEFEPITKVLQIIGLNESLMEKLTVEWA